MATQTEALIIDLQTKNEEKVKNIRTQIREATQDVASLTQKYGEFDDRTKQALKKLADLKDIQGDINDRVKALSPDRFERIAAVGQGLVGGFQTFSGILGAVGVKSEDWEKTMVRLQSLVNVSQGLQSFKQFYEVIKASEEGASKFATAIKGLGTGLVVGAVMVLAEEFQNVGLKLDKVNTELEAHKKALKDLDIQYQLTVGNLTDFEAELQRIELERQQSRKELFRKAMEESKNNIGFWQKTQILLLKLQGNYGSAVAKNIEVSVAAYKENLKNMEQDFKNVDDIAKKKAELAKAQEEKKNRDEAQRQYKDWVNKNEQINQQLIQDEEKLRAALDDISKQYDEKQKRVKDFVDALRKERRQSMQDEFANRADDLDEWYKKNLKFLEDNKATQADFDLLEQERLRRFQKIQDDRAAAVDASNKAQIASDKAAKDEKDKNDKAALAQKQAYITMLHNMELNAAVGLASNLSQIFGQQTKAGKAFALAEVAISEGRALASALANTQAPTPDNVASGGLAGIVKFLTIAASITSTAVRARNIIKSGTGNNDSPGANLAAPALSQSTVSTFGSRNLSGGTQTGVSGEYGNTVLVVESLNSVSRRMKRTVQVSSME